MSAAAPGPLSREEEEREEVRVAQSHVAVGVDAKHQVLTVWFLGPDKVLGCKT